MGHYRMRARVFVHTPDEYKAWVAQQIAGGTE
jgi:heme/copper-type cytochrome/quinol oxidase subunit 2